MRANESSSIIVISVARWPFDEGYGQWVVSTSPRWRRFYWLLTSRYSVAVVSLKLP